MPGPHPAVALTRRAVRSALADVPAGATVLVACSGGADSLALAAALAFEADAARPAGRGWRAGAVVVDHGWSPDSSTVAARALGTCALLGLAARAVPVACERTEAAAREARFAALDEAARSAGAVAVLLGHTRDDQAEQVLLGLLRGSGTRSLAGIPPVRGVYRRPFLAEVGRADTVAACTALGLEPWDDPANADPAFARVRARALLTAAERELGPGIGPALARSAELVRADADLLDELAARADEELGEPPWGVAALAAVPAALRSRVWRRRAAALGAPPGALTAEHVRRCEDLLVGWHGQGPVHLPGGVRAWRGGDLVHLHGAADDTMGPADRAEEEQRGRRAHGC